MGLFGKLFDKKICDICGAEIGMFGNKKLEDGNCCKACAAKLSPWFDDRRHSTVQEIKEQLKYREENRTAVEKFHITRQLGNDISVLIDEDAGNFMVLERRDVNDLAEKNPDVIPINLVTGCKVDVSESRSEVYREVREDGETKRESYSPRRYRYSYRFEMEIQIRHPYCDTIQFPLSSGSVRVESYSRGLFETLFDSGEGSTVPPTPEERMRNPEYARFAHMGEEIRADLMDRKETPEKQEIPQTPKTEPEPPASVICPWCGAPTRAGAKFCENCGGNLQ